MPITNKAYIWACSNNMNLHSFKEPIPTVYVLILNKCKCERNYLVVAIYTDCGEYLTFIPFSQKCAINADQRKTKLPGFLATTWDEVCVIKASNTSIIQMCHQSRISNTRTYAKEGSLHNFLSPSHGWY